MARPVASLSASFGWPAAWNFGALWPFSDEALREPADHVVVFSVDHGERAHAPRRCQYVEELAVVEAHQVVGHVNLEGDHALVHELRNLRLERLRRGVGDDQVEPVVGNRLRSRGLVVGRHHSRGDAPRPCTAKESTVVVPPQTAETVPEW